MSIMSTLFNIYVCDESDMMKKKEEKTYWKDKKQCWTITFANICIYIGKKMRIEKNDKQYMNRKWTKKEKLIARYRYKNEIKKNQHWRKEGDRIFKIRMQ